MTPSLTFSIRTPLVSLPLAPQSLRGLSKFERISLIKSIFPCLRESLYQDPLETQNLSVEEQDAILKDCPAETLQHIKILAVRIRKSLPFIQELYENPSQKLAFYPKFCPLKHKREDNLQSCQFAHSVIALHALWRSMFPQYHLDEQVFPTPREKDPRLDFSLRSGATFSLRKSAVEALCQRSLLSYEIFSPFVKEYLIMELEEGNFPNGTFSRPKGSSIDFILPSGQIASLPLHTFAKDLSELIHTFPFVRKQVDFPPIPWKFSIDSSTSFSLDSQTVRALVLRHEYAKELSHPDLHEHLAIQSLEDSPSPKELPEVFGPQAVIYSTSGKVIYRFPLSSFLEKIEEITKSPSRPLSPELSPSLSATSSTASDHSDLSEDWEG